jgi:hypothetical protein
MTDDGRLELDDTGGVVDSSGASGVGVIDLADLGATDVIASAPLDAWTTTRLGRFARRHRLAVAVVAALATTALVTTSLRSSPPPPPVPVTVLTFVDAPVQGADLGGPRVDADQRLSVAFVATASPAIDRVQVLSLVGPGLSPLGVEAGSVVIEGGTHSYLQLGGAITCDDPAIASATPSSYGVAVRHAETGGDAEQTVLPFSTSTTALDTAVRDACLATSLPTALTVTGSTLSGARGTSVADLTVAVRNDAALPMTVASERTSGRAVDVDQSPAVLVPAHGTATVYTRVLVHDCSTTPRPPRLDDLANPVSPQGYADPASLAGVTLRIGVGTSTRLASYALTVPTNVLGAQLAASACAGVPTLTARVIGATGTVAPSGGWTVTARLDVLTSGIGVIVGREHFEGAPDGLGSVLGSASSPAPGVGWVLTPAQLDGGAGAVPVVYSGTSCLDALSGVPTSLDVRIRTAEGGVYPFELRLDPAPLQAAAARGCHVTVPADHAASPSVAPTAA